MVPMEVFMHQSYFRNLLYRVQSNFLKACYEKSLDEHLKFVIHGLEQLTKETVPVPWLSGFT